MAIVPLKITKEKTFVFDAIRFMRRTFHSIYYRIWRCIDNWRLSQLHFHFGIFHQNELPYTFGSCPRCRWHSMNAMH